MFKDKKCRIQKLFIEANNPLSILDNKDNYGFCSIEDSTASVFKITVTDYNKNIAQVIVPITGKYQKYILTAEFF